MRRITAFIVLALLTALSITAAATADRNGRAPGVKSADITACPDRSTAKPQDDRTQGGSGGGGGSAETRGNPTGNGNGNANDTPSGNGGGNGGGNSGGSAGEGDTGGGQAGDGTRGNSGNANGGRGNGGRGNGEGRNECVDPPATPADDALAGDGTLPPAKAGTSVNVEELDGTVGVKEPGSDKFQPLSGSAQIPEGSLVDTRSGVVELTSSAGSTGRQQTAAFTGAKFQVQQRKAKAAVTDLVLRGGDFRGCPRIDHGRRVQQIRNGVIAAKHGKRAKRANRGRRLWGNGRGRFRTRGRWGSATVRGTVWQVEDTCGGTRTTVARGLVKVTDFGLNRRVAVRAGQTYFSKVRR